MNKHTPGPWSVNEGTTHVRVVGADGENLFHEDKRLPLAMGDARLISAAPELLEALNETDVDLTVLLSNIADSQARDPKWDGMYEVVMRWKARNRAAIAKATGK